MIKFLVMLSFMVYDLYFDFWESIIQLADKNKQMKLDKKHMVIRAGSIFPCIRLTEWSHKNCL